MSDTQPQPTRRLGRGLNALLGGGTPAHQEIEAPSDGEFRHVPISKVSRNPFQPRKDFDQESLGELARSIKEHGVLQPIVVREYKDGFQLIAGERRWLAAGKAGLTTIPCCVVDVIDKTACEFALEENLKRKDLNDLEKAAAFRDYLKHFECSIEELARQLSMSRSAVSNTLRLQELPDPVKNALVGGKISAGHARALLPLEDADRLSLCGRIQAENLSVRQTEAAVKLILRGPEEPPAPVVSEAPAVEPAPASEIPPVVSTTDAPPASEAAPAEAISNEAPAPEIADEPSGQAPETLAFTDEKEQSPADAARTNHVASLEAQLRQLLGVDVSIRLKSKEAGTIEIPFESNDTFERILRTIRRAAA